MNNHLSPVIVEIDGNRYEISRDSIAKMDFRNEKDGIYHLSLGDKQYEINVLDFDLIKGICVVRIDGEAKEIRILRDIDVLIEKMGLNASHSSKQSMVIAPMPGLVSAIKVITGQHVDKGTPLLILEAMKMENVIVAPHEAIIKNILVEVGQAVEKRLPLIEFS